MPSTLGVQEVLDSESTQDQLSEDLRWHLVQRLVASATFSKAVRLSNFLSYVCERQLLGRTDEITEHQIGIHVFGRPTDYNPGEDNIVRASARLLRQRLTQYFHEEGAYEPEWIVIPRGTYVPIFEKRPELAAHPLQPAMQEELHPAKPLVQLPQQQKKSSLRAWIWSLAAAALGLLLLAAFILPGRLQSPTDRLWATLFPRGGVTRFIAGDGALVILQNMTHRSVSISAYSAGNYMTDIDESTADASGKRIRNLGQRRYTSFADLKLASSLAALSQARNSVLTPSFARDVSIDDMKNGNLILSGDPQGNPWVELFSKDLNFHLSMDDTAAIHIVRNMHPLAGEQAEYRSAPGDPEHRVYALIALTHSLDGKGHVLLVEGTTVAGLDAAHDLLFSNDLSRLLRPAVKRDGLHDFEILLEAKNIAFKASGFQVIATRVH